MLKNKSTNELSVELHVENVLIINKKKNLIQNFHIQFTAYVLFRKFT